MEIKNFEEERDTLEIRYFTKQIHKFIKVDKSLSVSKPLLVSI